MFNQIGYSVYVSNFEQMKTQLSSLYQEGSCIFTSFHISEEFDETYEERARQMCRYLHEIGYEILADVSKKTLAMFHCDNIAEFAKELGISILRIDYGFTEAEIIEIGRQLPICINASTVNWEMAGRIARESAKVYGMHNFYPRPETGLDEELFDDLNRKLRAIGIEALAFIPGDEYLRGPLHESLPTLEVHRHVSPFSAYLDLKVSHQVDGIFVGDGIISQREAKLIADFGNSGIIPIPVLLNENGKKLYGKSFTIRADSPRWLKRFQESREYSCLGEMIEPGNCVPRNKGSITVDNKQYLRYSGEIQLVIEDLPADDRVNVVGQVSKRDQLILKNIKNGDKILLHESVPSNYFVRTL